ncbi:precorrin-2 C(20)-methyltransferase [Caenispirillum bisanense]|uniref:precorrin-2 C(20)-methyltransferase n=1 Tax=Caenispirillum bisanense TaxID=414052 RepID=UPI0031E35ED8
MSAPGTLIGVGVGPGDPELVTLKALRVIREAPVLAWPANPDGHSMARAVVASWIPPGKVEIAVTMDFVSRGRESANAAYDDAAAAIAGHLDAGRDVAVLCEGDPLFYGSFAYILARLEGRYPVAVVPGITSMTACAAVAARPIVLLDEVLTVLPATLAEDVLEARLAAADAAAIMKLGRHLPKVAAVLGRLGLAEAARIVVRAGHADQRLLTLPEALTAGVPYFSLLLVRKRP